MRARDSVRAHRQARSRTQIQTSTHTLKRARARAHTHTHTHTHTHQVLDVPRDQLLAPPLRVASFDCRCEPERETEIAGERERERERGPLLEVLGQRGSAAGGAASGRRGAGLDHVALRWGWVGGVDII